MKDAHEIFSVVPNCLARSAFAALIVLAVLAVLAWPLGRAAAAMPSGAACSAAIAEVEPGSQLPAGLLSAIGMAESGRIDPGSGAAVAWPWTINVAGAGAVFETQAAAMAAVRQAQQTGVQSIDVGCMQINLLYHPRAFADLAEAFEPAANVRYAARFLAALHAQTGDWVSAIAAYHSATPEVGTAYAQRVAVLWPQAAQYGLTATAVVLPAVLEAEVDPHHLLTDEFRARMIEAAAFRHRHEVELGSRVPAAPQAAHGAPVQAQASRAKPLTMSDLEAEVDPKGVLTPEFRARMVEMAALRHRQQGMALAVK